MSRRTRLWIAIALLAPFALVTWIGASGRDELDRAADREIPLRLGAYDGWEVELSQRTRELLGTTRVVNRTYVDRRDAGEVHLCVVRSNGDRRSFHPPEICYRGWGYEIEERRRARLAGREDLTVNLMRVSRSGNRTLVGFWYMAGRRHHAGFLGAQIDLIASRFFGGSGEGAMVRLSTPIEGAEPGAQDAALRRLEDFVDVALPALSGDADVHETRRTALR